MQVRPDGLTCERLNGVKARGLALSEGILRGETLAGDMPIQGVSMEGRSAGATSSSPVYETTR